MSTTSFLKELQALEQRFASLAPEMELTVRDPELGVEGYVVVWTTLAATSNPLGRFGKGGTRITPSTSLDEIKMLARIMALKNAAAGLPLGGAKSGLKDDPSSPGFEARYRRFARLVAPTLIENGGIFGGFGFDIGGRPEHVHWICEELKSTRCFTGKPIDMGGTDYDREGIAGLGVSESAIAALEHEGTPVTGTTFAVQGLGAMGAAIVRYFSNSGGVLRAVSDPRISGTYLLPSGASQNLIDSIASHRWNETAQLLQREGTHSEINDVLYQEVDILFPAAIQEVVTSANASLIKARRIVEGANNPCSAEARSALHSRGVLVLPDFLVNAGGIIAAYVEMTSGVSPEENKRTRHNVEEAKTMTRERMRANTRAALEIARSAGCEPVVAARYLALKNIFKS